MAKDCPNEIYYNDELLKKLWHDKLGRDETDANKIRDQIRKYR